MLEVYQVAFFGHRYVEDSLKLEAALEAQIRRLLQEKAYVEFLVGRNGAFDQLVSSVIRRVKREFRGDNSSLCLILPYETAEYRNNRESFEQYYDTVLVSEAAETSHPKAAIGIRNREMVERADLVTCYLRRNSGGAYRAVQYAQFGPKSVDVIFL